MDTLESRWRKSSYSGGNGGGCVEVGNTSGIIVVRDTTHRGGTALRVTPSAWRAFVAALKR